MRRRSWLAIAVALSALASAPGAQAQNEGDQLTGRFRVGYRSVSVDGQEGKYRQHYNLDDGPRLFEARFDYVPTGGVTEFLDVLSFDLNNYGGDPFETLRFDVRKFGKYDFTYERQKSTYFYQDIIFPPGLIDPSLDAEGDFTSFDVDRVRDHAKFDLTLTPRASLDFDFNRYTRLGESTFQLDIQREVIELDRPIDEKNNEFGVAFQYRWDEVALILQERIRDYDNATEIFLPGATEGTNPENLTEIAFFFLDQPYELRSFQHTARMNFTPSPEWIFQLAASVENLELDGEASETSSGIGFTGNPFMTDLSGSGDIERDTSWINADVSYLLNARVSIVGGFSRNDLDQNGDFSFGISEGLSEWKIATTGVEGGVQYAASESVTLTGGLRYESRDVDFGHAEGEPPTLESHETTHAGFFFTVNWSPRPLFNVNAQIESGSYDDPFTLASPSSRLRFRVQASSQLESGIFVAATYVGSRLENDDRPPAQLASDANWNADRDHINVRVGYRSAGVEASAGYAFVRAENSVNQTILAGAPLLFPILFESDANFADGRFRWSVNPIWRVGGDLRFYDNDGRFALKRNDFRVYGETTVAGNYLVNVGYRYVDYEEKTFGFNDYDAGIVEASIGYAW